MSSILVRSFVGAATMVLGLAVTCAKCEPIPYQGLLSQVDTSGSVNDVAVSSTVAYIADSEDGLVIVDVQIPSAPVMLGQWHVDRAKNVVVAGDIAYVTSPTTGQIFLVDVSDPTNPAQVGSIDVGTEFSSVAVNGSTLALSAAFTQLRVYDVRDPGAIELAEQIEVGATADVEFVGNLMYVLGSGLAVYDVSDLASVVEIGSSEQGGGDRLTIVGEHAYSLTQSSGISIYDVSDPTQPAYVDVSYSATAGGRFDLLGADGTMFVMDNPLLYQINLSDPSAPIRECWQYVGGTPVNIDIDNQVLYVASAENGLQIIDVAGFCGRCEADMTEDGEINFFDVARFITQFNASSLLADFTGENQVDFDDVTAFLDAYSSGCDDE